MYEYGGFWSPYDSRDGRGILINRAQFFFLSLLLLTGNSVYLLFQPTEKKKKIDCTVYTLCNCYLFTIRCVFTAHIFANWLNHKLQTLFASLIYLLNFICSVYNKMFIIEYIVCGVYWFLCKSDSLRLIAKNSFINHHQFYFTHNKKQINKFGCQRQQIKRKRIFISTSSSHNNNNSFKLSMLFKQTTRLSTEHLH